MAQRGRPRSARRLDEYLEIRVEDVEKLGFQEAAKISGIPLATWARERLRRAAIRELEEAARPIPFLS